MGKKLKWNLVLMSILYLGLGIFLLLVPGTAMNIVCYALGGVVLACAAVQLVRYFAVERGVFQSQLTLISGLVCLGLGAFLIIRSDIVVRILPIVFGLFVVFDSLGRIQNALELRKCQYPSWKGFLLLAVLSIVLGIVMILDPFGTMETLVMAIGVILIVEGALNLLSALYTVIAVKRFLKLHPETQSMLEAVTGEDLNGDASSPRRSPMPMWKPLPSNSTMWTRALRWSRKTTRKTNPHKSSPSGELAAARPERFFIKYSKGLQNNGKVRSDHRWRRPGRHLYRRGAAAPRQQKEDPAGGKRQAGGKAPLPQGRAWPLRQLPPHLRHHHRFFRCRCLLGR